MGRKIKQQRLTNTISGAQINTVGKFIYKQLVDGRQIVVQAVQINDGIIWDGIHCAEVFLADSDEPVASIVGAHRQAVCSADH